MRIGFHISIAGGFRNVVERAVERRCTTIQMFSRNPRGWHSKSLDKEDVALFRKAVQKSDIYPVFVHMPYLVNLAASDSKLFKKSVDSLIVDLKRSDLLGARFLIVHIGSSENQKKGIEQMIKGINLAFDKVKNGVILLLENTAGSGNELGCRFEQIKSIIKGINDKKRIGVVIDTAHAFAAGYDLRTRSAVEKTLTEFDKIIGVKRLKLIHLNDSKTECGSHVDRHWHVGKGKIGRGMGYIITHPLLFDKPFIMETPRQSLKDDLLNLRAVEKFLKKA
ncbi:MAG TPA: deoxyribonuclease IV [candidate division WOR-3 bacterium]|uniref:Probable endonuclease 4 n=1 Tax=candidate division WOR-3 bacterium TaxID=2052148 RepID=A0A9C9EKG5_UNCW3|nr:deoxyribonuclease IV [candidate division WOR-3 bacterium]